MTDNLNRYNRDLDSSIDDVEVMKQTTDGLSSAVGAGEKAISLYRQTQTTTEKVERLTQVVDALLKTASFISPIKTPVNVIKGVVEKVGETNDKLKDQVEKLDRTDDTSTPGREDNGGLIDRIETNLNRASNSLDVVSDSATLKLRQLQIAEQATTNFRPAIEAATQSNEVWTGTYANLAAAVERQLGDRLPEIDTAQTDFSAVNQSLDDFLSVFDSIDFPSIEGGLLDLSVLEDALSVLQGPLEAADSLITPIKPLFDAVDAIASAVVDPVIDYVIDTLQLDGVIERANEEIENLLPPLELLDALVTLVQDLQDFLIEFANNTLGALSVLDQIELATFDNIVGEANQGPTGWADALANTVNGDDGDDVLDGLGGGDTINGRAGDDIIIGGAGSDIIDGGSGDDLIHYNASFTEYELGRDPDTGTIIVSHVTPSGPAGGNLLLDDAAGTGTDQLVNLDDTDHVVWTDISFTGRELKNAIIGGSVLDGTRDGDLMFLNATGNRINGLFEANGRGGPDRMFGSTSNDRLNGGPGDDVLAPGQGDDEANGGGGRDTFLILSGARTITRTDLFEGTSLGQGNDTLSSIENLLILPDRDHKIRADAQPNSIVTGNGIDVISGGAGNDTIDSGGEDDFVVGGPGQDLIFAGDGRNVMLSGSAARQGVSDTYLGGEGFDAVGYTRDSNVIRSDVNNQDDDPSILQTLKNYLRDDAETSGPVVVRAGLNRIERYDDTGNRIATDTTEGVEGFLGSDQDDRLFGDVSASFLHGADGDDTIRTGGSSNIDGGAGDDVIFAEDVPGGPGTLRLIGGSGFDTLKLDAVDDARWFYQVLGARQLTLRAHSTTAEGDDLRGVRRDVFFEMKPQGIEQIELGDFADHAIYEPGGTRTLAFFLADGDDRFDGENGFADVHAGAGNDIGNFDGGGGGIFRGQAGDDRAVYDDTSGENRALMGSGSDFLEIERFRGHADGGSDFDTLAFDVGLASRIVADLAAGTASSFKGTSSNLAEQVSMTFEGFESLIATNFNDALAGSGRSEQLLGRAGNDDIKGFGGDDQLFGGDGDDRLEGGNGDDLLHGGRGADELIGNGGNDTASYASARPGGLQGAIFADDFGGVTVDLLSGTAEGAFGNDRLSGIENVRGSGGNDLITGSGGDNLLTGGRGDDTLHAGGGDDIIITGIGDDEARGGAGDDRVFVDIGVKDLVGGAGFDTLSFGTVDGPISIDFGAGTYNAELNSESPRWADRDLDDDGVNESDGTEVRIFDGVALTPQRVLEADPRFANSNDDTDRVLPDEDDPEFGAFQITLVATTVPSSGEFSGFEAAVGSDSRDRMLGGGGNDDLRGEAGNDFLRGGPGDDTLSGGAGNDQIFAGLDDDGDDILFDGAGNDTLGGGPGQDQITITSGADVVFGGSGADRITQTGASQRGDVVWAGSGGDTVRLGATSDTIGGGDGADALFGGGRSDVIYGGPDNGADTVEGGAGNDQIFVGNGNDSVNGNVGADVLFSGGGTDTVEGGPGRDQIYGGPGDDIFYGGNIGKTDSVRDVFLFFAGNGNDRIEDFDTTVDRIDADAPFRNLVFSENPDGDAVLSFANVTVTFTDVSASELEDPTLFV